VQYKSRYKEGSGAVHTYYNNYVKFEGVQRRLKFNKYFLNHWVFERRELNLNSVLNNDEFEVHDMKKIEDWFNEKQRRVIEDYI
jgi:hypothetical protein